MSSSSASRRPCRKSVRRRVAAAGSGKSLMDVRICLKYTLPLRPSRASLGPSTLEEVMTDPRVSRRARRPSTILWRDLLPFAFGALTMVGTSLALATQTTAAALHQVWVGFVPVGAIAAGACAASGYYVGAVIGGRRPGSARGHVHARLRPPRLCSPVPAAAQGWTTAAGTARPLLSSDTGAIHAVSLDPSGLHRAAVTGLLAYPLTILAGLGFAVGTAAVTSLLDAPIHCHRCRKYLPGRADRTAAWPACEFAPRIRTTASGRATWRCSVRRPQPARVDT